MMTEGVILAAGCSSRTAPDCKLVLMLGELTVLERSIKSMQPYCSHVFVVTGAHEKLVAGIAHNLEGISLVHNPDFMHGMYGSIKTGLRFTTGDRILVLPGDCPFITPEVYTALLAAEGEIVLPVWQGRAGHPVLLGRSILSRLLADDCNESLHQFILTHTHTYVPVHCKSILQDIDQRRLPAGTTATGGNGRQEVSGIHMFKDSAVRFDFEDKITGKAQYCADLHYDGMLYAKTVRSTKARAWIRSVYVPPLPNNYYVIDFRDIPAVNAVPIIMDDQPFFAENTVNYIGEPVLLVVGPDREELSQIVQTIKIVYEERSPISTLADAISRTEDFIFGDKPWFVEYQYQKGDIDSVIPQAARVVEDEFSTGYQEQAYLEPQSVLAVYADGVITVQGSMQCPYYIKRALKQALGWNDDRIQVIQLPTGGAFGGKEEYPSIPAVHAALAAIKTGKPVQLVFDRQEDMLCTTKRHPSVIRIKSYLDESNHILARDIEVLADAGAYAGLSSVVLQRMIYSVCGVYKVDNLRVFGRAYATNKVVSGAFRGFGGPQAFFAIEMHMEHIAKQCCVDPVKLRRSHFLHQEDTTSTGGRLHSPVLLDEIMDTACQISGYTEKHNQMNTGDKLRGIGCSVVFHGCGFTGAGERDHIQACVRLRKEADGTVRILTSSTEMGQGAMTTLSKIVAQTLQIPISQVRNSYPNTGEVPDSGPTVASRTVLVVGKLLQDAALQLKRHWEETNYEIEVRFQYPEDFTWDKEKHAGDAYLEYSWGANIVEVEVDPVTYAYTVTGTWAVYDIGTVIDEKIVEGQIEGGMAQGLGYGAMEVMNIVDSKPLQRSLTDYILPTSLDFPPVASRLIETQSSIGPYGARGAGEITMVGTAPALAAAVENAIGRSVTKLPITPEYIMELMTND